MTLFSDPLQPLRQLRPGEAVVVTQLPLDLQTLARLEQLCLAVPFKPSVGSGGDYFLLRARGIIANLRPDTVEICDILKSPKLAELFESIFGERVYIAHAQVNRLSRGESLLEHSHGDDARFAVIHFQPSYYGGRYFDYDASGFKRFPLISPFCMVASSGNIPHGVEEVTSAAPRITLVLSLEKQK